MAFLRKNSKYNNKECFFDELRFQSKAEKNRYLELKMLLNAGKIQELECQYAFTLLDTFVDYSGHKHFKIVYFADFYYFDNEKKRWIIEDVKGFKTDVYKMKKKLLLRVLPENHEFIEIFVNNPRKKTY